MHPIKVILIVILSIFHITGYAVKKSDRIYILEYTPENAPPFTIIEKAQRAFELRNCTFKNCFLTTNRSYFSDILDFDALLFNIVLMRYDMVLPIRSQSQKYILVAIETAAYHPISTVYNDYFNYTWTYKLESDIPFPLVIVKNHLGEVIGPKINMRWMKIEEMNETSEFIVNKLQTKKIAAVAYISNCVSHQRLNYINDLHKELNKYGHRVDLIGQCGADVCFKQEYDDETCLYKIETDYYFYLSFENSFAVDYVSESLLKPLDNFAVPVVLGGSNYSRYMPDGIYLDALKLGPAALAKTMAEIINDTKRYYDFFKWHGYYSFRSSEKDWYQREVCALCEILNDKTLRQKSTVFSNLSLWWNEEAPILHYDYKNPQINTYKMKPTV